MMKACEFCPHWAQWRQIKPDETVVLLCAFHKTEAAEKDDPESPSKFAFIGAAPVGA